jgi:3-oxoacyl-[acyl-carrier protein] reductase
MMFERVVDAYQGATVVVVGAGGIGGEIVARLSDRPVTMVIADHDAQRLADLDQVPQASRRLTRPLDVRDPQAVAAFFDWIHAEVGPPQFVFYTAGVLNIESFFDLSDEQWNRAVDINLNGAYYCVREAARLMCPTRTGSLLLLSSISGTKARSGSRVNPVYNTTKAAMVAMVNAVAMQLRPMGVRLNCISPGPTATSMMDLQPPPVHEAVNQIMLDHRMNLPAEIAELALFVAAHGRFTGEDIPIGGGAGLGA